MPDFFFIHQDGARYRFEADNYEHACEQMLAALDWHVDEGMTYPAPAWAGPEGLTEAVFDGTWSRWVAETLADGSIVAQWETNDHWNNGYPSVLTMDTYRFPGRRAFLHMSGGSRFAPGGLEVTVFLDGRNLEHKDVQLELGEIK